MSAAWPLSALFEFSEESVVAAVPSVLFVTAAFPPLLLLLLIKMGGNISDRFLYGVNCWHPEYVIASELLGPLLTVIPSEEVLHLIGIVPIVRPTLRDIVLKAFFADTYESKQKSHAYYFSKY